MDRWADKGILCLLLARHRLSDLSVCGAGRREDRGDVGSSYNLAKMALELGNHSVRTPCGKLRKVQISLTADSSTTPRPSQGRKSRELLQSQCSRLHTTHTHLCTTHRCSLRGCLLSHEDRKQGRHPTSPQKRQKQTPVWRMLTSACP